jgi:hypothetical protein
MFRRIQAGALPAAAVGALMAAALPTSAARATVIDLTYDSVMDMVRPEVKPNIPVHHNLQVTLSGGNGVSEHRDRNVNQYSDRNAMTQVLNSTGDEGTYASWSVAPDNRLIRVQNDPQSTRTMTVTLTGNTCHLDVVDRLKPGFSEYAFLRITTHTIGYFSSYRVVRTTCAVR